MCLHFFVCAYMRICLCVYTCVSVWCVYVCVYEFVYMCEREVGKERWVRVEEGDGD